jgi:hypothetical protein
MRFVENHRVARRQQFGRAFVAQHHVGKKQVMIDHHQIGGQRFAARRQDEAFLVLRAVLAEAVVARRGDHAHTVAFSGTSAQSALSPLAGLFGEARDVPRVGGIVAGKETPVGQRALEMVVAEVVGAALEQAPP